MSHHASSALPPNVRDAALRLVGRLGPDGFTMDDLARESGVGRATLYRQVGNREAVLEALVGEGVDLGERADVQERILAACRVVFPRAGFDAATLEDVAREAEVGTATVYRQFKDKDGLIRAFSDRYGPRRVLQEVAVSPSGDLRADLERVASGVLRAASEDLDLFKLAILERLRGGRWAELMRSSPISSQKTMTRLFKSYSSSGVLAAEDPARMARAFFGMLLAFLTTPLLEGRPMPDPDDTARFITRVFLEGLSR